MAGKRPNSSACIGPMTLMDLQMPEMNGMDAMIALCGEFPGARIVVLTTGHVQVLRALKAGARSYLLEGLLRKELLEVATVATELAEHATDDALSSGEIKVLRLVSGGNANKRSHPSSPSRKKL